MESFSNPILNAHGGPSDEGTTEGHPNSRFGWARRTCAKMCEFLLEGPFAVVFLLAGDVIARAVRVRPLHRSRGSGTPAVDLHVPIVEKPWA